MELILRGHIIASYLAELIKIEPHNLEMTENYLGTLFCHWTVLLHSYYKVLRRKKIALGCLFLERRNHALHRENLWGSTPVPDIHAQEGNTETKQMQTRAIRTTQKEKSLAHWNFQTNARRGLGGLPKNMAYGWGKLTVGKKNNLS